MGLMGPTAGGRTATQFDILCKKYKFGAHGVATGHPKLPSPRDAAPGRPKLPPQAAPGHATPGASNPKLRPHRLLFGAKLSNNHFLTNNND